MVGSQCENSQEPALTLAAALPPGVTRSPATEKEPPSPASPVIATTKGRWPQWPCRQHHSQSARPFWAGKTQRRGRRLLRLQFVSSLGFGAREANLNSLSGGRKAAWLLGGREGGRKAASSPSVHALHLGNCPTPSRLRWQTKVQICVLACSSGCQRVFLLSAAIDWSGSPLYGDCNSSLTDQ